jgi:hypothetical protein
VVTVLTQPEGQSCEVEDGSGEVPDTDVSNIVVSCDDAVDGGLTGWYGIESVSQRECTENRGFEVNLKAEHDNPNGCSNNRVLEVPCRYRPYRTMVTMFLQAFSNGYEVEAYVQGCDGDGQALVQSVNMR